MSLRGEGLTDGLDLGVEGGESCWVAELSIDGWWRRDGRRRFAESRGRAVKLRDEAFDWRRELLYLKDVEAIIGYAMH